MAEALCLALANLDFEYELAAPLQGHPATLPNHFSSRWRWILRLLPQARQAECLDPNAFERHGTAQDLVVWGVTPRTTRLAESLGLVEHFPAVDLVRQVNDKRFSHALEQQLGIALPHSQVVESLEQFRSAVEFCPHDWVLKHPLGFSARERVVGKSRHISDSAWGWTRRKLSQHWTLLFEPWANQRQDFSLHFEVDRSGAVRFLGQCQLISDPGGVYRGNSVDPTLVPKPQALECGHQVAGRLARMGYWGPVGLDAFSGLLGDRPVLRPLVEINARCSFGRLALALRNWIPQDWCHLWWHPGPAHPKIPPPTPLPDTPTVPGLYSLPLDVDPPQTSGTLLFIAPTNQELQQILTRQAGAAQPRTV